MVIIAFASVIPDESKKVYTFARLWNEKYVANTVRPRIQETTFSHHSLKCFLYL